MRSFYLGTEVSTLTSEDPILVSMLLEAIGRFTRLLNPHRSSCPLESGESLVVQTHSRHFTSEVNRVTEGLKTSDVWSKWYKW